MLTIAVDAMGGDNAPKSEVEGAVRAARALGVKVILVGQQDAIAMVDRKARRPDGDFQRHAGVLYPLRQRFAGRSGFGFRRRLRASEVFR